MPQKNTSMTPNIMLVFLEAYLKLGKRLPLSEMITNHITSNTTCIWQAVLLFIMQNRYLIYQISYMGYKISNIGYKISDILIQMYPILDIISYIRYLI